MCPVAQCPLNRTIVLVAGSLQKYPTAQVCNLFHTPKGMFASLVMEAESAVPS